MFELHPQLAADCVALGDLPLSQVLLLKDANYPWLILVPRRPDVTELFELTEADQRQFIEESSAVARRMARYFAADKMNIAALGNRVAQLHVHHIVRYQCDPAWPAPVWGAVQAKPYTDDQLAERSHVLRDLLADAGLTVTQA